MASIIDQSRVRIGTRSARSMAIVVACLAAGVAAYASGDPAPRLAADPETAQLLRSMALIKAMFLAPALALVLWRARGDVGPGTLLGYAVCVTVMSAAMVSVFQLSHLAMTSLTFHAALIFLLILAWRDEGLGKGVLNRHR